MMHAARWRRWSWCIAASLATGGCTEINTSPTHVASLVFDRLPSPAVVTGDTLRDSLGIAAPLLALAYNNQGDVVASAPISFITLDTGVTVTDQDYVVATRRSGAVPLVAGAGAIQSRPVSLIVTRRPDSAAISGPARDTVDYLLPDNASANTSVGLAVQVITGDSVDGTRVTQGWRVAYEATFRGTPVAPGDTTAVFLVDGAARTSVDTTDANGVASRAIRVRPIGITVSAVDSVIVLARVTYKGVDVRGSPLRFVIFLQPRQ